MLDLGVAPLAPPVSTANAADLHVLTLSCPNAPGIVAAISQTVYAHGGDIQDSQQFDDSETRRFFMRIVFSLKGSIETARLALNEVGRRFQMAWNLRSQNHRSAVMLMASKAPHCLADLLFRWRSGELSMDVVGVISNHPLETYAHLDFDDVPFHYLPVTTANKAQQEAEILRRVDQSQAELVVLARYMQILSDETVANLSGRCINIHHSFLPGFKGAKPYHQAHARGVKLIGATAHYVTAELDEGPIIEQEVERISHKDRPNDLVQKGQDIERRVLARAVNFHLQGRVLLNGAKTVVFRV